jgi:capsular exopolysaccharide synthesis family protein
MAMEVQVSNALKSAQDEILALNRQLAESRALTTKLEQQRTTLTQVEKRIANLELQRDAEAARYNITVIEPARIVDASLTASPVKAVGLWMIGAATFGVAWAMRRDESDRRLRCADDVHEAIGNDVPILGVVPRMPKRRTHIGKAMATHLDPRGAAAEAHRTVRSSLLCAPGATRRTIFFTSPNPGDGKSVCATNLCIALAQAGKTVVLVDADLRRPTQHINLDLHDGAGLCDAMDSVAAMRWAIQPSGIDNFHALIAGRTSRNPSEVFSAAEFRTLLSELSSRYDHVVIDSAPVNVVNDSLLIAGCVDSTVLVVRAEHTTRDDVARALDALKNSGARMAGVVVNAAPVGENFGICAGEYFATIDTPLRSSIKPSAANAKTRPITNPIAPSRLQPV